MTLNCSHNHLTQLTNFPLNLKTLKYLNNPMGKLTNIPPKINILYDFLH